jgi:hypothetical protein
VEVTDEEAEKILNEEKSNKDQVSINLRSPGVNVMIFKYFCRKREKVGILNRNSAT